MPTLPDPRLYHELHITVEPKGEFPEFADLAERYGWRASRFDEDLVDDYNGKWFMSARTATAAETEYVLRSTLSAMEKRGFSIMRWKVEDTLLDSKYGDTIE